jgi:hypothetical protein
MVPGPAGLVAMAPVSAFLLRFLVGELRPYSGMAGLNVLKRLFGLLVISLLGKDLHLGACPRAYGRDRSMLSHGGEGALSLL